MTRRSGAVAAIFVLVGIGLLAGAGVAYYWTVALPRTWPTADALVVSSRVINPRSPSDYTPEFIFRLGDGSSARDVRIVPSWRSSSYALVQSHLDRYPRGQRITVAVNPADANDVRYDLTLSWTNLLLPGILGLIGIIFTAVGFFAGRAGEMTDGRPTVLNEADRERIAETGTRTARLVGRIFAAIGVVLATIGIFMARSDLQMLRTWPRVDGRVIESHVVPVSSSSSRRGANRQKYDASVTFRYAVNGVTLESGTTYGSGTSRSGADARAESYAAGTVHAIWYRPEDPRVIRFDLDNTFRVFIASGVMIAMGVLFFGIGVVVWRASSRASGELDPATGDRRND